MKKILVPLLGRHADRRAVATAFRAAERFGASVHGLSVTPPVEIRAGVEESSLPSGLVDALRRAGAAERDRIVAESRALFDEARDGREIATAWAATTGSPAEVVAEETRLADLVVLAPESEASDAVVPVIEAALFGSGRQVLLAPKEAPAAIGHAVAIAWDGGPAAARAVTAARPFLRLAERVEVLCAGDPLPGRAADPERLAEYLALYGVATLTRRIPAKGRSVSRALSASALDLGCDLLVMGAYGHSRIRELILGGVTQDVLRAAPDLPILAAH